MKFFKDSMSLIGIVLAYPVLAILVLLAVAGTILWQYKLHIFVAMIAVCLIENFR